jgi:hypothetical protein
MKIRLGFVSNSSSSSFICDVSGHVEAGMDLSMSDAEMVECVNNHTFMEEYICGKIHPDDRVDDWRYEVPENKCPICTMKTISNSDLLNYILKTDNINPAMLRDKIRNEFGTHKAFHGYLHIDK